MPIAATARYGVLSKGRPLVNNEQTHIITQDGTDYLLHDPPGRSVITETGQGMPEIEYVTERGPFQHGETMKGYFLRPRVYEARIRQLGCSRNEYWALRAAILDILRPNRGGNALPAATLRKIKSDGTKRDLTVAPQQGPRFEPSKTGQWDEWSIDEIIRLVAYNPVWFDPTQNSLAFSQLGGLTFPITFPIIFSASGNTLVVPYVGTWFEFPTILLTGPMSAVTILNVTTGESIGFTYSIPASRVVTINLQYGNKSVTLDDGTNLIGYITISSSLASFHLQPGNNTISVLFSGGGATTGVVLNYYNRYIGI